MEKEERIKYFPGENVIKIIDNLEGLYKQLDNHFAHTPGYVDVKEEILIYCNNIKIYLNRVKSLNEITNDDRLLCLINELSYLDIYHYIESKDEAILERIKDLIDYLKIIIERDYSTC